MIWVSVLPGTWESNVSTRVFRCLLVVALLLPAAVAQAQQQTGEAAATDQQAGAGQAQDDNGTDAGANAEGSADADSELPDIDSQPIEGSQSPGPGRFIPSEQISQDFGVSFPVDI